MIFILIGDTCLYFIGKKLAQKNKNNSSELDSDTQENHDLDKLVKPEMRAKVQGYFDRYGSWAVFFGRFVAGNRGASILDSRFDRFPH